VQNIGHQSLESHILHARNILCSLEILRGPVRSTLSRVVNEVLQQGIRKNQLGEDNETLGVSWCSGNNGGVGYNVWDWNSVCGICRNVQNGFKR
jgi:hypothetical protein